MAIGDAVLDLCELSNAGLLDGLGFAAESVFSEPTLNAFMARERADWRACAPRLGSLLGAGGDGALQSNAGLQARCQPRAEVAMHLPAAIGDYTDFYLVARARDQRGDHVPRQGQRAPAQLAPPARWLPRPRVVGGGERHAGGAPARPAPARQDRPDERAPSTPRAVSLDFELEMGFFVRAGKARNSARNPAAPGALLRRDSRSCCRRPTMEQADERIFGFVLCNDWSARDVQKFEYVPLSARNLAPRTS